MITNVQKQIIINEQPSASAVSETHKVLLQHTKYYIIIRLAFDQNNLNSDIQM